MPKENTKKYYWLRLHRDFFKRHDIQIVESMPNGKDYILFYLKLLVESVDHEGNLRFSEMIPYSDEMLSALTHTNIDVVRAAMKIFTELGMISILDDSTIYMEQVSKMIGTSAQDEHTKESTRLRVAKYRERKALESNESLQERYSNATCNGEIEIEKEIDIDNTLSSAVNEIVAYLNEKCGTNYKASSDKTRNLIKARFNNGFTVEDFKKVIDIKHDDWIDNSDMHKFLRPETLFGNKFEGYLNQKVVKKKPKNQFNEMIHTDYDMDELERRLLERG